MSFFYNLNKRLADLSAKQDATHLAESKQAKTVAQSPLTQALNEAGQRRGLHGEPEFVGIPGPAKGTKPSPKAITKGADREYYKSPGLMGEPERTRWRKKVEEPKVAEAGYSAKAGRAGKDLGKPGKNFSKIAKGAAERYGSKAAGERVAGAVLNKLRHPTNEGTCPSCDCAPCKCDSMDESAFQAAIGKKKYGDQGMKALQKAGREHASVKTMSNIRKKYDKYDESMDEGMFGFGMPQTSVSNNRLMVQGDQKAGNKVMAALQKANPQLAAQGKHSGASGPDGPQYLGIQFATPQLAQQAAQALQGGMEEGNAFTGKLKATPKGGKFKLGNKEFKDTSSIEENYNPVKAVKQCAKDYMKMNGIRSVHDLEAEDIESIGGDCHINYQDVCEILGCNLPDSLGPVKSWDTDEHGNKFDLEEGFADMDAWLASREKEKGTGNFDRKERTLPSGMKATTYTRKHEDDADDDKDAPEDKGGAPKKKGRPKGKDKGPERVTAKSYKYKAGRPTKTAEDLDSDSVMMTRPSNMSSEGIEHGEQAEYNDEAGMAKDSLHTIVRHAKELERALRSNENMPEWVQEKIGQIKGMMTSVTDYIISTHERDVEQATGQEGITIEPVAERSKSQAQARMMAGAAHNPKFAKKVGVATKVAKEFNKADTGKDISKLPKKVKKTEEGAKPDFLDVDKDGNKKESFKKAVADKKEKKVDETTVAGSVATATPSGKSSKGGMSFGKGVYESFNNSLEKMISESIDVTETVNEHEQEGKTITVTASGPEADALMQLLKAAGLSGQGQRQGCGCSTTPCSCETVDEAYGDTDETLNNPDWPTDTEKSDNAFQYSGGLNGPKSTGQTTTVGGGIPNMQARRQVSMEENVKLERSLFKTWKNYKG